MKKQKEFKFNYTFLLLGLLGIVVLIFTILKPATLWQVDTWKAMTMQFPEYGVFSLGVMLCFIVGCIDVSFVSLGNFASILACMFMVRTVEANNIPSEQSFPIIVAAILIAMVVGGAGGFLNGNLISRVGIPPILATLATQMVFRGLAVAITKGDPVTNLPPLYSELGHTNILGFIPVPLVIFLAVFAVCAFLLKYTTYGKKLYMAGANPKAARFSAINVTRTINTTFVINGVCAAIGAMLMVSTMNSAKADYGSSYLMRCILILVLAGVLPNGGMGKARDVLISVVIIQIISSGVNMFAEINSYYSSLISAILLLVVLMTTSKFLTGTSKPRKHRKKAETESA